MYIFGGKDHKNVNLNDFWRFDFEELKWTQLSTVEGPSHRSGHSCAVYKDFLIIQGGIFDVTKELNDMHVYSFKQEKWICLFSQVASPLPKSRVSNRSPDGRFELNTKMMSFQHTGARQNFLSIRPTDQVDTGPGSITDKLKLKPANHRFGLPLNRKKKPSYETNKPDPKLKPFKKDLDDRVFELDNTSNILKNRAVI